MKREKEYSKDCPLCVLKIRTKVYHETDDFIVLDCKDCELPMFVMKKHGLPHNGFKKFIYDVMLSIYPGAKLRKEMRSVPDHFHFHIVPDGYATDPDGRWVQSKMSREKYGNKYVNE
jgi:hypothetical protein